MLNGYSGTSVGPAERAEHGRDIEILATGESEERAMGSENKIRNRISLTSGERRAISGVYRRNVGDSCIAMGASYFTKVGVSCIAPAISPLPKVGVSCIAPVTPISQRVGVSCIAAATPISQRVGDSCIAPAGPKRQALSRGAALLMILSRCELIQNPTSIVTPPWRTRRSESSIYNLISLRLTFVHFVQRMIICSSRLPSPLPP